MWKRQCSILIKSICILISNLKQSFKLLIKQVFDCLSLCFMKRNFTPLQFFQGDYCKICDVSVSFPPVLSNSVFIQCAGSYWDWITRSARAGHQILCYLWISPEELSIVKHVNFKVIKWTLRKLNHTKFKTATDIWIPIKHSQYF